VTNRLLAALSESDAQVAAFYPYLYYPSVKGIGHVPMPGVLHPAAHDEPALYLPIFRGTYTNADAICYHTIAERRLVQRIHPSPTGPRSSSARGLGPGGQRTARRCGARHRRAALRGQCRPR